MNEVTRTAIFLACALFAALLGFISTPWQQTVVQQTIVGEQIFPEFKDPLQASSLEIVKFDDKLGALDKFRVAKKNGRWVIPSQQDYPADAEQQLRDAAVALLDLKILGTVSEKEDDWSTYGVVAANDDLKPEDEGVGLLVSLGDSGGKSLAQLIIGKEAKGGENLRFVRRPDQAMILVTKIDPAPFKTNFSDWIEKDLLSLNGWDIARLALKDYSLIFRNDLQGLSVINDPRMDATVAYDDAQSKWTLDSLTLFGPNGKPVPSKLGEYEELDNQKLNDLKFAIDDLKIVDVVKKPAGLGASLTADESFLNDNEARMSLLQRGFLPYKGEILARNGEVRVATKEGVEYILRFGEIAGADQADAGKLNRYMFVTTRVDEKQLVEPQYEPEPVDQPAPATPGETKPPVDDEKKADSQMPEESPASEEPATDAPAAQPAEGEVPDVSDTIRAERERIRKLNQRKKDEYEDKLKKAKARSGELNARFADWYYVVSEDTYKKIHLSRSDIIKESSKAKEEGFGVDAFRELETQGLQK